jgi:hypothetical protein
VKDKVKVMKQFYGHGIFTIFRESHGALEQYFSLFGRVRKSFCLIAFLFSQYSSLFKIQITIQFYLNIYLKFLIEIPDILSLELFFVPYLPKNWIFQTSEVDGLLFVCGTFLYEK